MTEKSGTTSTAAADDDELSVPRSSVNKIIRELAPLMRVSNDTRELIVNCCNEFIHLLASEANDVCNHQTKKTIAPEHVLIALENLGFKSYLADVKDCIEEAKEVALKKRRQSTKLESLGIPEEELLRQQQELFAKAREEQAALDQQEWQAMQQQVNMAQAQAGAPGMYAPPGTIPQYSHHPGMVNPYQPGMPGMPGAPATVTMLPSSTPQPAATSQSFTMPSVPVTVEDDDDY